MAEIQNLAKFLNPLTLHLQKLDLELKCPLCLNLLKEPMLLPCNHIFCHSCISSSFQLKSECSTCKTEFSVQDLRPATYLENLVAICKGLHSTFTSVISCCLPAEQSPASLVPTHIEELKREESKVHVDAVRNSGRTNMNNHASFIPLPAHDCKGTSEGLETQEDDIHRGPQPSPESSPSLSKDRNCIGNASDSGSMGKCQAKIPGDYAEKSSYARDVKRQKMLDYSSSEADANVNGLTQENVGPCDNTASSNSKLEEHVQPTQSQKTSVCGFCHTSTETDGTGPLLYYADGKEVDGELTTIPNVIPVHSKCVEWTPQTYFKGDIIMNLESELGRSAKLKCSSCGQKGAALGCFVKSCRRTYHVPCAFKVQECRWDCEGFLMLCPSHNSLKFPGEKSRPKKTPGAAQSKNPVSTEKVPSISEFWANSPSGPKEWVFCGSALSTREKFVLVNFATMCGATVAKFYSKNVTHVIAATDEKGACTRTLKVLMGILNGKWILNMGWIQDCAEVNYPLNEEPYEISLDNHGCLNGPKTGRLRVLNKEPKLFEGVSFYFTGDFGTAFKFDLVDLVRTAGGAVHESMAQMMTTSQKVQGPPSCLVVYNGDPPQGCSTVEGSSIISQRKAEAHDLANQMNCSSVGHKWILDSIAACIC